MSSAQELIGNLQAAIQSQEAAEQAHEDWQLTNDENEKALALALERRQFLQDELKKREHDLIEGRKHAAAANAAWWQFCRVAVRPEQALPLPSSPAPSAATPSAPGAPKKEEKIVLSRQDKALRAAHRKAARQLLIAGGDEEAIAQQAKIDARIAKMKATQAQKKQASAVAWSAGLLGGSESE